MFSKFWLGYFERIKKCRFFRIQSLSILGTLAGTPRFSIFCLLGGKILKNEARGVTGAGWLPDAISPHNRL